MPDIDAKTEIGKVVTAEEVKRKMLQTLFTVLEEQVDVTLSQNPDSCEDMKFSLDNLYDLTIQEILHFRYRGFYLVEDLKEKNSFILTQKESTNA